MQCYNGVMSWWIVQSSQRHVHPDSEVRQILSPRTTAPRGRHHASTGQLRDTTSPGRFHTVRSDHV